MSAPHVVLLGDSIFDNAAYVPGEPPVEMQLREAMPDGQVTLLALDGAVVDMIPLQLARLPEDTTHLVLSVGGNDALGYVDVLTERVDAVGEAMLRMADIAERFEQSYRRMLDRVMAVGIPTTLCTVYYPSFPEEGLQRMAIAAETFFNDAIMRCAFEQGVPLIDLRLVCDEPADYANPIEPSAQGGWKIVRVIARVVRDHDFSLVGSTVYAQP